MRLSTHSQRLERWFGPETVEHLSRQMLNWYGPPILVGNLPGASPVYVGHDGDFVGPIKGGAIGSFKDFTEERIRRIVRNFTREQRAKMHTGFSSLSDLISEATTGGKRQDRYWIKGATTAAATNQTMWPLGSWPLAGSAGAAIPGGASPTRATVGGLNQDDPGGSDTLHITTLFSQANVASQLLLLYDRIFHASSVLHSTTGNQAVSGVPARYQDTTAAGTFITLEVTAALGTTAHNCTITYMDQDGNTAEAGTAQSVIVSAAVNRLALTNWFYLLNSGDTGARKVTNIAMSAVNTNNSQLVLGHPLVWIPQPVANSMIVLDGINSCFSLVRVLVDACLAFMSLQATGTATTYQGNIIMVSG